MYKETCDDQEVSMAKEQDEDPETRELKHELSEHNAETPEKENSRLRRNILIGKIKESETLYVPTK